MWFCWLGKYIKNITLKVKSTKKAPYHYEAFLSKEERLFLFLAFFHFCFQTSKNVIVIS